MFLFFLISCTNQNPNIEVLFNESLQELNLPPAQKAHQDIFISTLPSKEKLSIQYFAEEDIVYLALNNYMWLDEAKSTSAATLTITQIAVFNYELIGTKLQLNPKSGAIILAAEMDSEQLNQPILSRNISRILKQSKALKPRLYAALDTLPASTNTKTTANP